MAFETTNKVFKKSKDLAVGESLVTYVTGYYHSEKFPEVNCLECVTDSGERFVLSPHGNLKYFKDNGNELGLLYRITRLEDKQNKRGTMSAQFTVEVDRTKKVELPKVVAVEPLEEINF